MDLNSILLGAFLAFFSLFAVVFVVQRLQWRRKHAVNKKHLGFYPSAVALSLALLNLQHLAQPDLGHSIEKRHSEPAEEDDDGGSDDPSSHLTRQLKRIRRGKPVGNLKVPYRMPEHKPKMNR